MVKLSLLTLLLLGAASTPVLAQSAPPESFPAQIQVETLNGTLRAAPSNLVPLPLNGVSLSLIREFEGWSPTAYDDVSGYCTIGYGHLIALKSCSKVYLGTFSVGLTREQGDNLLEVDTRSARLVVQKAVLAPITDEEFGALVSFVFNVGQSHFLHSELLTFLQAGKMDAAYGQFGRWIKAQGVVQNGLVTRRKCEAKLFKGELALDTRGRFDRRKCEDHGIADNSEEPIDIYEGEVD